ncbi:PepSY-associated TM helix domain-containing protein [Halothiobacillus sp.]|uniref:PepSY-associated TM helix domain-containing protein n=1 Tax=Halothiobacillus sp. TaxID=1891311 RepID=UPI002AD31187|nr:PepSY-associated TM helix domain-containing protein [Halothiobacillus sp.]
MSLLPQAAPSVRKPWAFRLHTWLGTLLLIPVTLVALSGVGLAFAREFERVLTPDLWTVSALGEAQGLSPTAAVHFVHQWRTQDRLLRLEMPNRPQDTIVATVLDPRGQAQEIFIDPYRQRIVGQRLADDDPVYWLGRFHRSLSTGLPGQILVVFSSLGVIMLFLSGRLWRRRRKGMRSVALHPRLVAIASAVWLICATTGVVAVFAGASLNPLQPPNKALFRSSQDLTGICTGQRIDTIWWRSDGASLARCIAPGSVGPFGQSYQNGAHEPASLSVGDWLEALHTGAVLGIGGRVLWFWGVLMLPFAMLAGLLAWRSRVRKATFNPAPE